MKLSDRLRQSASKLSKWGNADNATVLMRMAAKELDKRQAQIENLKNDRLKSQKDVRSAQWAAFDKVLMWVNSQEGKAFTRKQLHHAVIEMRPDQYKENTNG